MTEYYGRCPEARPSTDPTSRAKTYCNCHGTLNGGYYPVEGTLIKNREQAIDRMLAHITRPYRECDWLGGLNGILRRRMAALFDVMIGDDA